MKRFWSKVDRSGGPDACWPWQASHFPNGYGQFRPVLGGDGMAHRWAFRFANHEEPGHLFVLHSCGMRNCCNPKHLRLGSHAENMQDMVNHGHSTRGEKSATAKLTEDQAKEIRRRRLAGEEGVRLAREFAISKATVCLIFKGKRWAHVG